MANETIKTAEFHLPGLFEFDELYEVFIPLFYEHRDWFYDWAEIASVYGAPVGYLWGGGRVGFGDRVNKEMLELLQRYGISARLTFSNSLLAPEHLKDRKCNELCSLISKSNGVQNGVIVHSDLLLDYLMNNYPELYLVSSTTKVLTDFADFKKELARPEFSFAIPDFRLNKDFENLKTLAPELKDKVEFLCNECCFIGCTARKACYENVSRKSLGEDCPDHVCQSPDASDGYRFSEAMQNPAFIGIEDIKNVYMPMGFSNFKIEGRSLGSAVVLEMLLYYLAKPQHHLEIREQIYLDSSLDIF